MAIIHVDLNNGQATGIEFEEITHSLSARRKKEAAHAVTRHRLPQGQELYTASTISIKDFLDVVNVAFQSVLSKDVLQTLNGSPESDAYYTGRVLHSDRGPGLPSARQVLARAFEGVAETATECMHLTAYKAEATRMDALARQVRDMKKTSWWACEGRSAAPCRPR